MTKNILYNPKWCGKDDKISPTSKLAVSVMKNLTLLNFETNLFKVNKFILLILKYNINEKSIIY